MIPRVHAARLVPTHDGPSRPTTEGLLHRRPAAPPVSDLRVLLYALKISQREESASAAKAGVTAAGVARDAALERARQAEERARAAQEKSGFWSDVASVASTVATVAGVVAAAAAVVCSGGSAVAIVALAGTALSASSPLIARGAGEDAGKAAFWVGTAASLGAAGYQIAGAAVSGAAASAGAREAGTWALGGARVAEGGARVQQGYATAQKGEADASVLYARADGAAARAAVKRSQAEVDAMIDLLREVEASVRRAAKTILAIGDEIDSGRSAVIAHAGRRFV